MLNNFCLDFCVWLYRPIDEISFLHTVLNCAPYAYIKSMVLVGFSFLEQQTHAVNIATVLCHTLEKKSILKFVIGIHVDL